MDRSECPTCGAPCTGETVPRGPHSSEYVLTYATPPPAEQSSGELLTVVADAIRSTGHVTNTDKWEVASAVMAALSQRPAAPDGKAALHASIVKEAAEVLQMVADSGVTLPPNWRWPLLDELSGIAYMLATPKQPEKG